MAAAQEAHERRRRGSVQHGRRLKLTAAPVHVQCQSGMARPPKKAGQWLILSGGPEVRTHDALINTVAVGTTDSKAAGAWAIPTALPSSPIQLPNFRCGIRWDRTES